MNLVWLKLIKRILTHKYYVANIAFKQDYIGKVLLMICLNLVLQNFQELLSIGMIK